MGQQFLKVHEMLFSAICLIRLTKIKDIIRLIKFVVSRNIFPFSFITFLHYLGSCGASMVLGREWDQGDIEGVVMQG